MQKYNSCAMKFYDMRIASARELIHELDPVPHTQ